TANLVLLVDPSSASRNLFQAFAHQVLYQANLVFVVRQGLRAIDRNTHCVFDAVLYAASFEYILSVDRAPRDWSDCAKHDARLSAEVSLHLTLDGHTRESEIPAGAHRGF